jgi:hypothetical protein
MASYNKRKYPGFSPLELESRISVPEAAKIKGVSQDTFERHYAHLIEKTSPRRNTVKLRHALADAGPAKRNPSPEAA